LEEVPLSVVEVALDYSKMEFQFYLWDEKPFTGAKHHTHKVLNFIGKVNQPHSMGFSDFVGRLVEYSWNLTNSFDWRSKLQIFYHPIGTSRSFLRSNQLIRL
jgi:hypothetical protein